MLPHVELVPKRNQQRSYPHYDIFAGSQLVGVITVPVPGAPGDAWTWSINTICVDGSVNAPMKGYTHTLEEAKVHFRKAFDIWLAWAIAMPRWDLKRGEIDKNLKAIGVD
jgi:hypothetical protein